MTIIEKDTVIDRLSPYFEEKWLEHLLPFFKSKEGERIFRFLGARKNQCRVLPDAKNTFNAFKYCPWNKLKVVIIGTYPFDGLTSEGPEADGLAFSAGNAALFAEIPNSTKMILEEVERDCYKGQNMYTFATGFGLQHWAEQGVLLLNQALTTEISKAGSHIGVWRPFIEYVLKEIQANNSAMIFVQFGQFPDLRKQIDETMNYYIKTPNPDPIISNNFTGCSVFSQCNEIIENLNGKNELIKW